MESMERHQERFSKVNQKHLEQLAAIRRGMEERLAKAARIRQHKHDQELLIPGSVVDFWRGVANGAMLCGSERA